MITRGKRIALSLVGVCLLGGCSAPTATLDLITVARKGFHLATQEEMLQHAEIVRGLETQLASLDSAFDADVLHVASGQVRDADGNVVGFSPEWVISARQGYGAARGLIEQQIRSAQIAHEGRKDNLKAADEALEMASQLVVAQWNVAERIKQHILNTQTEEVHQ